ncbi:MAG: nickel transporter [Methylococcaceae bacterium]|nr:nickel transporter [Methylococcaceae bacterium]
MQIIPVIDLKQGLVVHARQGLRDDYKPVQSQLCQSPQIFDVLNSFWSIYDFSIYYIADLDAITQQGDNSKLIAEVIQSYSDIVFWVDSGYPLYENAFRHVGNYLPVLGSESFREDTIDQIRNLQNRFLLSLDYSMSGRMGATSLFLDKTLWPEHIIIMTLARVGSNIGPDFDLLTNYRKQHPEKRIIAAGGIRHSADILALEKIGVNSALVATALHNGTLSKGDISFLQTKKYPG